MDRRNIFLGGFMASGKSSVAKLLAQKTGRTFIDTDLLIERREKLSVAEIFSRYGEEYFRRLERKIIREVSEINYAIIALGGGVLADPGLKEIVKSSGRLVILSVKAETILNRTVPGGERPLLDRENVQRLIDKRAGAYDEGDLIIETDNLSVEEEVDLIIQKFQLEGRVKKEVIALEGHGGHKIFIGSAVLDSLEEYLPCNFREPFVITDRITGPLYSSRIGRDKGVLELPRGEKAKTLSCLEMIYSGLQRAGVDRYGSILTLGGGTVGDVGGFAAATWMRGIKLINCPTTLLAQVDSAIGGKNGINLAGGKNLAGTFYQPSAVFSDIGCLLTLSDLEFRQGLAEVVKYGLGHDKDLFDWLKINTGAILDRNPDVLMKMVEWCTRIKVDVVSEDERERTGQRARLNLGHTIAHGIEAASGYAGWKHGDAVSVGMLAPAFIAVNRDQMTLQQFKELYELLKNMGLPVRTEKSWEEIMPFLGRDKKFQGGNPRIVMPIGIGHSVLTDDVGLETLEKAYREVMNYGQ